MSMRKKDTLLRFRLLLRLMALGCICREDRANDVEVPAQHGILEEDKFGILKLSTERL